MIMFLVNWQIYFIGTVHLNVTACCIIKVGIMLDLGAWSVMWGVTKHNYSILACKKQLTMANLCIKCTNLDCWITHLACLGLGYYYRYENDTSVSLYLKL